jgi:pilus assembly protein CpaC
MKRVAAAVLLAGVAAGLAPGAPVHAQALKTQALQTNVRVENGAPNRTVAVAVNKSAAFRLEGPVGELVVAQPDLAQIVAVTDHSFYVRGKAIGATNILVYDRARRLVDVIDVQIGQDVAGLQSDIGMAMPNEKIIARPVGKGVLLTGQASTPSAAARARTIAERYLPAADVATALDILGAEQVQLEVRVLEASRSSLKELGIDLTLSNQSGFAFFSGSGLLGTTASQALANIVTNSGTTNIDVTIQALEEKGLLRTLARPNLTALSGEAASFLAGGEFPIPVAADYDSQGRTRVGIEFKEFGVKLGFKPTVRDGGLIRLEVAPEVSQIDTRQTVRLAEIEIPGLSVRRASTVVELRDGESFAVAGLFQQEFNTNVRQLPFLGDIPVLGALFRSSRWRRNETELVIIVTPRVVQPTRNPAELPDPLVAGREPGAADIVLQGRAHDKPLKGPVGAVPAR